MFGQHRLGREEARTNQTFSTKNPPSLSAPISLALMDLIEHYDGVLTDIWPKDERGKSQTIYGMLTFIRPCVVPICYSYITANTTYSWIYWSTSLFEILVQILVFAFLSKSFASTTLARKAKKIWKTTGWKIQTEYNADEYSKIKREIWCFHHHDVHQFYYASFEFVWCIFLWHIVSGLISLFLRIRGKIYLNNNDS